MKKDLMVWFISVGLFLAGGVFFHILPSFSWDKKIGVADAIGLMSVMAAAFAAIAAWRSAAVSQKAAEQSRLFSRMQAYILHRQHFEVLLGQMEKEYSVVFGKRDKLYNDIFPDNRHMDRDFNIRSTGVQVDSWKASFKSLMARSNKHSAMDFRELGSWMIDQVMLSGNYLKFDFEIEGPMFHLGGIKTNVGIDEPMLPLKKISDVLNQLLIFGMVDEYLGMSSPPECFHESLCTLADSCPNLKHNISYF